MSESRSEMKRGTEVFTAEMERLIGEMSKLSQDSLRHHVKRMRSLQRQCVAKRDGGRAYLFLRFADVAAAYEGEHCDWEALAALVLRDEDLAEGNTVEPAPPTRRVRWPEK